MCILLSVWGCIGYTVYKVTEFTHKFKLSNWPFRDDRHDVNVYNFTSDFTIVTYMQSVFYTATLANESHSIPVHAFLKTVVFSIIMDQYCIASEAPSTIFQRST